MKITHIQVLVTRPSKRLKYYPSPVTPYLSNQTLNALCKIDRKIKAVTVKTNFKTPFYDVVMYNHPNRTLLISSRIPRIFLNIKIPDMSKFNYYFQRKFFHKK
jgi:hypothetical protein